MKQEFAAQYSQLEQWHWWFRGRQRILETVLQRALHGQRVDAIVSLGCGPAAGLQWLTPFICANGRIVGVDAEPLHASGTVAPIEFVIGELGSLALPPASFDAVLALDVLEHLDDDAAGLRAAAQLVKPGGLLLVTVPALPSLWGSQDVVSHHCRRYTKGMLAETFQQAGLPAPRQSYFNTLLFPPIAAVRWTRRALGLAERARADFDDAQPGLFNEMLVAIFALERHLVPRVSLPVGVSLLATLQG